jgi:hypothetical protein
MARGEGSMDHQHQETELEKANKANANMQAVLLSGAAMAHIAGSLSAKFDTFATWLLAGFGGAVALLLTSHEVNALVAPSIVRYGAKLFLAAVFVTVVEKYISIMVAGGSEGAEFSRTAFEDHFKVRREQNLSLNFNMQMFIAEFLRPIFKPALWFGSFALRKIAAGDFNAGVRQLVVMSQIQGALLLLEIGLFVAAVWRIVEALPAK